MAANQFADQCALHDLIEEAPELLPLSGSPRLVVVGREVAIGGGYADSLAYALPASWRQSRTD
jgi:hypothetical protein